METTEQLDWLRVEGCNEVQGIPFSGAKPAAEVSSSCFDLARGLPRSRKFRQSKNVGPDPSASRDREFDKLFQEQTANGSRLSLCGRSNRKPIVSAKGLAPFCRLVRLRKALCVGTAPRRAVLNGRRRRSDRWAERDVQQENHQRNGGNCRQNDVAERSSH